MMKKLSHFLSILFVFGFGSAMADTQVGAMKGKKAAAVQSKPATPDSHRSEIKRDKKKEHKNNVQFGKR
jgi:hypothetical protein